MAKATSDAVEILKKTTGIDPDRDPAMMQIAEGFRIAQMVYDVRTAAGMTQKQLADAIGTTQSVISRIEDAEYDGHGLAMLRRIAKALGQRVEIRMVPEEMSNQ
jgi:predicted transcriptional regulator